MPRLAAKVGGDAADGRPRKTAPMIVKIASVRSTEYVATSPKAAIAPIQAQCFRLIPGHCPKNRCV